MSDHNQVKQEEDPVVVRLPEWGNQLRSLREERGLSAQDIARELYLDVALIEALEDQNTDSLPSNSFIKGYLRNYARVLDVPCDDIIKAFECVCAGEDSSPCIQRISKVKETTSKDVGPRYATWSLVVAGLVLLLAWWWAEILPSSTERKLDVVAVEPMPAPMSAETNELQADIQVDGESVAVESLMVPDAPTAASSELEVLGPELEAEPELEPSKPASSPVAASAEGHQRLHLRFTQDSWVDIKDATGKRLFYDIGKEGTSRDLEGIAPFKILLGHAPGVELDFNDERIDHVPFQRNGVARFSLGE